MRFAILHEFTGYGSASRLSPQTLSMIENRCVMLNCEIFKDEELSRFWYIPDRTYADTNNCQDENDSLSNRQPDN